MVSSYSNVRVLFTVFMEYLLYYISFRILSKYLILVITVSHYRAYIAFDLLESMETLYGEINKIKIQSVVKFFEKFYFDNIFVKTFVSIFAKFV